MANMFSIILTIATLVTGIVWCFEKFKWKPARQRKVEALRNKAEGLADGKLLSEVAEPKKWVESTASFFPVLFVILFIRSFIFEPFQIPSGSMMPNLLVGDFIVVKKYAYGLKDPITHTTLIKTGQPKRGDVAVFKYPKDTKIDYVKRVVGEPGDKIIYNVKTKELTIYPNCSNSDKNCDSKLVLNLNYSPKVESDWYEFIKNPNQANFYLKDEVNAMSNIQKASSMQLQTKKETLGDKTFDLLTTPNLNTNEKYFFYKQENHNYGEWTVPQGHYFMMGDNRDNSQDSRFWGFVPESYFVGKVTFIWLSLDKQPNEWPTGIRFNHMGNVN